jgi:hypothetical protein
MFAVGIRHLASRNVSSENSFLGEVKQLSAPLTELAGCI